jgi:phosphate transport system substrate-binding protein
MLSHKNRTILVLLVSACAAALALATCTTSSCAGDDSRHPQDRASVKAAGDAAALVDPTLPPYRSISGVSGSIKSVGSDTMNNLMTLWAEGFKRSYPNVRAEIEGKGSSTAPPALIAGTATFGPMSRDMKSSEIDAFDAKYGYKPTLLPAAIDMLAVYVHRDNPIQRLTLEQLDAMYSQHRKGGYRRPIHTWGDLGLTGEWKNRAISLYGRNAASGTYAYFKENALFGGDYRDSVIELPGSSSVVQAIAADASSIGYSGIGFATAGVRAVPLATDDASPAVPPRPQYALTGEYPLARFLWIAVNVKPGSPMDPLRQEFIRYVYSAAGQSDVVKDGYFPVTPQIATKSLATVGLAEP